MKIIKIRIYGAPGEFQFRHLRSFPLIGTSVTQFTSRDKPAGVGSTALAIDPPGARSGLDGADDIVAPGVAHHQQLVGLASKASRQAGVERPVRLDRPCIEGEVPDVYQIAQQGGFSGAA
jgi:hypothetical protein